jgi:hypothetical protein
VRSSGVSGSSSSERAYSTASATARSSLPPTRSTPSHARCGGYPSGSRARYPLPGFLRRRLCLRIHRPTPPRERVRMPTKVAQDRSAPEAVRVWLLGDFSVSVGERKVDETAWRLRKAASLMKLLTLAPGHRLHREQAMDFLWPDSGKKAASNNLSQILHVARRSYQGSWMRRSAQLPSGFVRRLLLAYSFRPSRPSRRRRSPPTRASTTCRPRELALWVGSRR